MHVRGNYLLEKEARARVQRAATRESERENGERRVLDASGESRREVLVAFERLQRLRTAQALEREKLAIKLQTEQVTYSHLVFLLRTRFLLQACFVLAYNTLYCICMRTYEHSTVLNTSTVL